jgi:hypothetical protein
VTIHPNPDPAVNPLYQSYEYMGGGPVYKVPAGMAGAGNLLMVYHAEIPTIQTQSFDSLFAASIRASGRTWTALIWAMRSSSFLRTANISTSTFGIGWPTEPRLGNPPAITRVPLARALITALLEAAFGSRPHAVAFQKYYDGWHLDQGLGGYSQDLNSNAQYRGELQVAYNSDLQRYQVIIGEGVAVACSKSSDAMNWSLPTLLFDFRNERINPPLTLLPSAWETTPAYWASSCTFSTLGTQPPEPAGTGHL